MTMFTERDREILKEQPIGRLALKVIKELEDKVEHWRDRYRLANEQAQVSPGQDESWKQVKISLLGLNPEDLRKLRRMDIPQWGIRQQLKQLAYDELKRRGEL